MMQKQRQRMLSAALSLLLLLTAAGCAPAPDAEKTPQPSGTAAQAEPIELVTAGTTPEPTSAPTPDPLLGGWTSGLGGLGVTFFEDGSCEASYGGKAARGAYTKADGLLTLSPAGGRPVELTISAADDALQMGDALILSRADGGDEQHQAVRLRQLRRLSRRAG